MSDYYPSITLAWDANSEPDFWHYRVWRATQEDCSDRRLVTKTTSPSVTFTTLPNGTYYFTVTAKDQTGNESPHSDVLTVTQSGATTEVPSTPGGFGVGHLFEGVESGTSFEFESGGDFGFA